jgi:hypothetical protein
MQESSDFKILLPGSAKYVIAYWGQRLLARRGEGRPHHCSSISASAGIPGFNRCPVFSSETFVR